MEKVKTVLDRKPISSEKISSKQDFGKVMAGYKALKPPVWKSAWFYGTTGLATIAIVATAVLYNPSDKTTETAPMKATSTSMGPKKTKSVKPEKKNFIAQANPEKKKKPIESQSSTVEENIPEDASVIMHKLPSGEEVMIQAPPPAPARRRPPSASTSMMPHLGGVFFGEIAYSLLCSQDGIQCNDDLAIISFDIQFYNGRESIEKSIKGNVIPSDLCETIAKTSMGNTVSITRIKAEHRVSGRTTNLTSMNLVPTIK